MSENAPLMRGVVVAHLAMAEGLVSAVRHITGIEDDALTAVTNSERSPDELAAAIDAALGPGPAVVFTDLPTGSCGFAARRLTRNRPDLLVVCGVNLPVLLDFAMNRHLPAGELVPRLVEKGRGAIMAVQPTPSDTHGGSAVSGG